MQLRAAHQAATTKAEIEVLLPVEGIHVDGPLTLGQLHLRPLTEELRAELTRRSTSNAQDGITPEIHVQWALRDFTSTVASFRARASGLRTLELALTYAEAVLPMLVLAGRHPSMRAENLAITGPDAEQLNATFRALLAPSRLPHSGVRLAPPGPQHLPAVIVNGSGPVERAWVPRSRPGLRLTEQHLSAPLLSQVLTLVDREANGLELKEFDESFLRAARWYVNAAGQRDPANAVIGYVTCLEVLFSPGQQEGQPISGVIAEALAFLHETSVNGRQRLYKEVKTLYSLRSKITHGATNKVDPKDLAALEDYALRSLSLLSDLLGQWTSRQDLRNYLQTVRWSSPLLDPRSSAET